MALVLADRVKESATTTGTGTVTLLGAAIGFQSFAAIGDTNTAYYTIAGQTGSEWEVGIGTYTTIGTTLARTTVLSSSNAGSLVNFSAGTKDVFVTYPSEKSVNLDASGNATALGTIASGNLANATALPISTGVSGLGAGVATALGVAVGSAGGPVTFNGAGGTPSSLALANATGLPTAGLDNDAVTYAKMQNIAASRLSGRATASSGDMEEITLGTNLSFSGTTLNAAGGTPAAITVANEATDTTCFPAFFTASTGDLGPKTVAGLTLDSATATMGMNGVKFPATQVASADANTLDDYEEFTSSSTACTGALTISMQWSSVKIGKTVTLLIPAAYGAGVAVASFTLGQTLPAKLRPLDTIVFSVFLYNNNTFQQQPGQLSVATSGVMTVYLNPNRGGAFTVAANCGFATAQSATWRI